MEDSCLLKEIFYCCDRIIVVRVVIFFFFSPRLLIAEVVFLNGKNCAVIACYL